MDDINPLVSVVVITYNSALTVLETLDSIKNQTYKNLELIVSDDCSKDSTVEICNKWIEKNRSRFVNVKLITSSKNTGVCKNINRGVRASHGEWIKSLAGDDTLTADCISTFMGYISQHPDCRICFAKMKCFGEDEVLVRKNQNMLEENFYPFISLPNKEKQFIASIKRHILPGPGLFYHKTLFDEINGFDETRSLMEEEMFEIQVLRLTRIHYIDSYLINWRISSSSLCHSHNPRLIAAQIDFQKKVRIPMLLKHRLYLYVWDTYIEIVCRIITNDFQKRKYLKIFKIFSPIAVRAKFVHLWRG